MMVVGLIAALLACLASQAFFAASEISLVAADELKVKAASERGEGDARMIEALLAGRDRLLALALTGVNLSTAIAAAVLTSFLHQLNPRSAYLAPFILVPLALLAGESLPKLFALRDPLSWARIAGRPLRFLAAGLAPLLSAETALSRALRRVIGVAPELRSPFLTRDDLMLLIRRRPAESKLVYDAILPAESQMIGRILRFARGEARKAMVPLVSVEAIPEEMTVAGAIEVVRREGFSRLPVFRRGIVDIVGVVHVFDLLEAPELARPVSEVMRPVSYFSEATPLDEVLLAMQRTGENLAVVVDEYGGASGIITVEDLLEEVVGEIEDEHDISEELARVISPTLLRIAGSAPVAQLNERFALRLPEDESYVTIGGLVVERLGHIAKAGEQLKAGHATITVVRSDARAVRELIVRLDEPLRSHAVQRR